MSRGHLVLEHAIDQITVGRQYRRDLGDLDELMSSIQRVGLLHPISVTSGYVLISGNRRLAALRQLGRTSTSIWVVPDVSDKLATVLAIQDENTLHKSLSTIEQAELYSEVKALYADEAQRRDAQTRFGSPMRDSRLAEIVEIGGGGADSAPPREEPVGSAPSVGSGKSRAQAARAVTGRDSSTMLDQVSELQQIAARDEENPLVRQAAAEALLELNQDGKVNGRYVRVKLAQHTAALRALADNPVVAEPVRAAARQELTSLAREENPASAMREAALAVARVAEIQKADRRRQTQIGWTDTDPFLREKHEVRKLVDLLRREHGWWDRFEPAIIGRHATDEQWELITSAAAGAQRFINDTRPLRATPAEED